VQLQETLQELAAERSAHGATKQVLVAEAAAGSAEQVRFASGEEQEQHLYLAWLHACQQAPGSACSEGAPILLGQRQTI
jgi:hypothetical protein